MKKLTRGSIKYGAAAAAALLFVGFDSGAAQTAHGFGGFGLHIGGRNVHLDIGNPHGRQYTQSRYASSRPATYRRSYSNPQWYGRRGGGRAHYDYHDTSHYDQVPARYVPHGNHVDYIPAQRVWHQEGHFDRHQSGRRGGHH